MYKYFEVTEEKFPKFSQMLTPSHPEGGNTQPSRPEAQAHFQQKSKQLTLDFLRTSYKFRLVTPIWLGAFFFIISFPVLEHEFQLHRRPWFGDDEIIKNTWSHPKTLTRLQFLIPQLLGNPGGLLVLLSIDFNCDSLKD